MIFEKSKKDPVFNIKIAAPISSADEVEMLASNGADEFYCGIVPEEWVDRYSCSLWLNRRGGEKANLSNFSDLSLLVERAHNYSISVFLTLNAPYYTGNQMPHILDMAERFYTIGVDGLIVSDLGLILAIIESRINIDISVSSVAAVHNSEAVKFFKDIGVRRIILPRHTSLEQIKEIKEKVKGLEYEVFILNDGCVYEEGFCSTTHAAGPFCMTEWHYEFYKANGTVLSDNETENLNSNLKDYEEWIWYMNNCGSSFSERGLPNGPCGLCAIHDFYQMGIDTLKIVGREASPYRKLRSLQMVKAVVGKVKQGFSKEKVCKFAMEMRGTKEFCDSGYMCYYREAKEEEFLDRIVPLT